MMIFGSIRSTSATSIRYQSGMGAENRYALLRIPSRGCSGSPPPTQAGEGGHGLAHRKVRPLQILQTLRPSAAGVLLGKPDSDWLYGPLT
jgi:hypothetical protein